MQLTQSLAKCFGPGNPGWLMRDVAPGTSFDFREGKTSGPQGLFARVPGATRWARVEMTVHQ